MIVFWPNFLLISMIAYSIFACFQKLKICAVIRMEIEAQIKYKKKNVKFFCVRIEDCPLRFDLGSNIMLALSGGN